MRKTKLFLLLIISISLYFPLSSPAQVTEKSTGNEVKIKWYSFEEAYKLNKKKPKKMIVDIYTEWCGWCKRMDAETFTNPVIVKYMNAHFYCVKFDAERKDTIELDGVKYINPNPEARRSTHQLANILLRNSMSYPSYTIIDEKGKVIVPIPGYHQAKEFEAILSFFGENVYLNSNQETLQSNFNVYVSNFKGEIK